jgi:hypothetical protein
MERGGREGRREGKGPREGEKGENWGYSPPKFLTLSTPLCLAIFCIVSVAETLCAPLFFAVFLAMTFHFASQTNHWTSFHGDKGFARCTPITPINEMRDEESKVCFESNYTLTPVLNDSKPSSVEVSYLVPMILKLRFSHNCLQASAMGTLYGTQ